MQLQQFMGKGEASCLAIAQTRGWLVATDERRRVLRYVREKLGEERVINTPGLLIQAIRTGVIDVAEADKIKAELEGYRFRMRFRSFADVLDKP